MLFNSVLFLIFFTVFLAFYVALRANQREQNKLLLIAGLIFYGTWDWRFVFLLIFTGWVDYCSARWIDSQEDKRKKWGLICSIVCNLTVLGFFKYFNFFVDSFEFMLERFGMPFDAPTLRIILPVGLSFYTFQSMGYVIDVYRGKIRAEKDRLNFAVFVSFFPQLVAGPIERAQHLLPQIHEPRLVRWNEVGQGASLFLWGLVKKVVVADQAAKIADLVFQPGANPEPFAAMLGVYAFAIQIYGDFSGYTDMARGIAKIMGFNLTVNFKQPYLASNPSDFWKRWHISLSTWMRDYLYISLGGNRSGGWRTYRNLMITMILAGLWHGASWMFILWGAYHGFLLVAYHAYDKVGRNYISIPHWIPSEVRSVFKIAITFQLICIGWVFFRAPDWTTMTHILSGFIQAWTPQVWLPWILSPGFLLMTAGVVLAGFFYRWNHGVKNTACHFEMLPILPRTVTAIVLILLIVLGGSLQAQQFIYFQF